jgi:hypothetical protein
MIQNCELDADRLAVISECTETYGMEDRGPANEWVWNMISTKTVVYACGAIGREGENLEHNHAPAEIELCQRLAQAVAAVTSGEFIEMGDEGEHEFQPFYVVANVGQHVPAQITEDLIRKAFGGTIYPDADVLVEPIEAGKNWWIQARSEDLNDDQDYCDHHIELWSKLQNWFHSQVELQTPVFISIDPNDGKERAKGLNLYNGGCVLPRLIVGMTATGSLVGLFSCVVYT